jgi:hypothetical protein
MNPMLTLVGVECTRCGSTSETVQRDRELLPAADIVCCDIADLVRLGPREPYGDERYYDLLEAVECFYCGEPTRSPFRIGNRAFCCKGCGSDYGE